jgi:hypothetical protein
MLGLSVAAYTVRMNDSEAIMLRATDNQGIAGLLFIESSSAFRCCWFLLPLVFGLLVN